MILMCVSRYVEQIMFLGTYTLFTKNLVPISSRKIVGNEWLVAMFFSDPLLFDIKNAFRKMNLLGQSKKTKSTDKNIQHEPATMDVLAFCMVLIFFPLINSQEIG